MSIGGHIRLESIIFVGGGGKSKTPSIYSHEIKGKLKDNWGMYQTKYSTIESNKKTKKKKGKNSKRKKKKTHTKPVSKGKSVKQIRIEKEKRQKVACFSEVRRFGKELHPEKVRMKLSKQIHRNHPSFSRDQIFRMLNAYYYCCMSPEFVKKGQINTLRLHLEEYLISEGISASISRKFLVAENSSSLKHNGIVDVANVVNSIHRCFLLNKSVPQKMEELALENEVGFTKKELVQLAELYMMVLKKMEKGTIEQICLRHKFSFHSKSARILVNRISEFNPKQAQNQNSHKNNGNNNSKTSKNFNITGEKHKKTQRRNK